MYWFPKTKIGKVSFWLTVSAFAYIHIQYGVAIMIAGPGNDDVARFYVIIPGLVAMLLVIAGGISSVVATIKHKDRAWLLYIPMLMGVGGILFLLGEFLFPH
ncbi:MAG: hypothetical protein QS98_C0005G0036 [archaeon GW2011_AR3]|nr:MAG: hypothetical protein QS98_C0005G0036 [archaeon GW2011_AR3]MBS3109458.1 hypothetical protein [Candidatus Woesearchaeota archaeon]